MVAKPHNEEGKRSRAGVPLARAQRLSEKADAQVSAGSSSALLPMVAAAVLLLGGGAYYLSTASGDTVAESVSTDAVPAPVVATVAPVVEVAPAVAVTEASSPAFAPRPVLAPCINRIEGRLKTLQAADVDGLAWEIKRDRIRSAAQAALDCAQASVNFEGDFELTATEFADLHVLWDRDAATLAFTIVDSIAPEESQVVLTADGQPTEFIVH